MDVLQVDGGSWAHPVLVASTDAEVVEPVTTPEIAPLPGFVALKLGGRGEA